MPTVIDTLIVRLGLDKSAYRKGAADAAATGRELAEKQTASAEQAADATARAADKAAAQQEKAAKKAAAEQENLMHRDLGPVVGTLGAKKSRRETGLKGSSVRVS
ncbi:hypothetical protein KNO81_42155 [Paraburkholderia sediminicola]|nr:hypothetical protein [Paraburkholderia sediminicola]